MYINFKKSRHLSEEQAFEMLCLQLNKEKNGAKRSVANWKRVKNMHLGLSFCKNLVSIDF